ncbi:MAG: ribonuclease III [Simkaniaceae bacterium]|nr:ribonuclease III [Simkaniaceae bacterium]
MINSRDILKEKAALIQEKLQVFFHQEDLLLQAFTHSSYCNEDEGALSNERLEFLGDAVLGQIIATFLFKKFPNGSEGELSKWRSHLVDATSCVHYVSHLGVAEYVLIGRGELKTWERGKGTILADLFEAIIGAIYLDQGYDETRKFIEIHLTAFFEGLLEQPTKNYKSLLQDYAQKQTGMPPVYTVVKEEGPDHAKLFYVTVHVGERLLGEGVGASKKGAEQNAAEEGLKHVDVH